MLVRVPANGPGDVSLILSHTTQKMALDTFLLNIQLYKVHIKGKWSNPEKGVSPSPTLRCRSYWKKKSHQIALDYGRPTYI